MTVSLSEVVRLCMLCLPGHKPTILPSSLPILYHDLHFSLYIVCVVLMRHE